MSTGRNIKDVRSGNLLPDKNDIPCVVPWWLVRISLVRSVPLFQVFPMFTLSLDPAHNVITSNLSQQHIICNSPHLSSVVDCWIAITVLELWRWKSFFFYFVTFQVPSHSSSLPSLLSPSSVTSGQQWAGLGPATYSSLTSSLSCSRRMITALVMDM